MKNALIAEKKSLHKVLKEISFEVTKINKGYSDRALRIDLDNNEISINPIDEKTKKLWTGGKGYDLWLTFKEIDKNSKWDSPENPICFSPGPLGGTTSFPGSGKTLVTAISPLTNSMMDCNVGGYFGPFLKFSGFDILTIVGKAKEEIIVLIDAKKGRITIETAPKESIDSHLLAEELTKMYADNELDLRNIACVSAGRGADHTRMGVLNFSFWDWRRAVPRLKQAGRGGIGTVFRNKKIKALVLINRDITPAWRIAENKVSKYTTPKTISKCDCKFELHEIINRWNANSEFVIEMMQDIQERFRHISKSAIDEINILTKVPKAYLYHIASFYKFFSLEEKGKTTIQVCMGTTCNVKGATKILEGFEQKLNIKAGETTEDKKFTLEAVACLGACSIAPVVKIGDFIIGDVKVKDIKKILNTK